MVAGILLAGAMSVAPAQEPGRNGLPVQRGGEWQDTTYAEAVIELEIDGGPSATIPALAYNSTLLLPLSQFFSMAGIHMEAFALRDSATAVLQPGNVILRFNPSARILTKAGAGVSYDTMDVVWWDGDLFVATELLDRLLGVSTSVTWADLSVLVGRSAGLPVVRRARRERTRQLLRAERPTPGVLDIPLEERTLDGAVLSWSLAAATRGPTDQLSLDLGLGAGLLGGGAELRQNVWTTQGESGSELRASWSRVWPDNRRVRQVRVGDVQSGGRRSWLLRGVVVTNSPFIRSSEFDLERFVGTVPAGWEVELYGAGRLLAYSDADAVGAFRVPLELRYGQNPFELVLHGPAGELVRRKRTIRVPFSRLPGRTFEYAVAAGRCRFDPCEGILSADARYGMTSRLTVQGGWDAVFEEAGGTLWQPYAAVSAAPHPALGITGEAVRAGHLRVVTNFEPHIDLRIEAGHTAGSSAGARYTGGETSRSEASLFWRPGWMSGLMFFQGNLVRSSDRGVRRALERLTATTRIGRVRYSLGLLRDAQDREGSADTRRFAIDAGADAVLFGPWRWLRRSSVQLQVAVEPSRGLAALRGTLGRRIARTLRMDGSLGWFRDAGYSVELGFATALPGPRFGTRSRHNSRTGTEAAVFANGSLAWDPRTRTTRLGEGGDLGRAGISGVLFRDDNGNGTRDQGEPGLSGIPVLVGGWAAQTDAQGRFAAWGMYPSEPLQIDVDSLSFEDPHLVLPAPIIRVRPVPNSFGRVEVPVMVGAEVSGYVVLREEAIAGVPVILRELNTGAEIVTTTFSDGGFYKAAIPPGEYEITLPDDLLVSLDAYAPPLHILVPPGAGLKRYQDLHLRLEPRQ
jgi:hypothetical protein